MTGRRCRRVNDSACVSQGAGEGRPRGELKKLRDVRQQTRQVTWPCTHSLTFGVSCVYRAVERQAPCTMAEDGKPLVE